VVLVRAAFPAVVVLRRWSVQRSSEGQLLLEQRLQLVTTLMQVAAVLSSVGLFFFALSADKLHHGIRGAMCAYGVLGSSEAGFPALYSAIAIAIVCCTSGLVAHFEGTLRRATLARPLSILALLALPVALWDARNALVFYSDLDLSVVASCCSVELESDGTTRMIAAGPRVLVTGLATVALIAAAAAAWRSARKWSQLWAYLAVALGICAAPLAAASTALFVAPHVFESPENRCPFCLLRGDAWGIGYPLFLLLGLGLCASLAVCIVMALSRVSSAMEKNQGLRAALQWALRRSAVVWLLALAIGATPALRFWWLSGGQSLFH
jgi:hypothetical protein